MKTFTRALAGAVLVAVITGCASFAPSRAARSELEDSPVPKGLAYRGQHSPILASRSVKAAKLVYRGRVEPVSLGSAMRSTLEASGWRHVSSATAGDKGTTQVYEKASQSLQVKVWESWYYTYVELTASRATAG